MSGVSPGGVAENGTRSGKGSFDLLFMRLIFPNLLPCLPSLAAGLVPAGQHYYEGSEFCQPLQTNLTDDRCFVLASDPVAGRRSLEPLCATFLIAMFDDGFSAFCIWQTSLLISIELPNIPSPTTLLPFRQPRFNTSPGSGHRAGCRTDRRALLGRAGPLIVGPWRAVKGSCFARTLPDRLGRIEFTYVTDCSFTSGCSPPFLTETQLPLSVTGR